MNRKGISKLALALFLTGGAVALGPSGCTPSSASLCNRVCECTGCSKDERADCVDDLDDARKEARNEGCGDQYDAYFSCAASEMQCEGDSIEVDGCDTELRELRQCMGDGVPVIGKDACQAALDRLIRRFQECDIAIEAPPPAERQCSAQDAALYQCYVPCYEASSCDVLTGEASSDELNTCITSCF